MGGCQRVLLHVNSMDVVTGAFGYISRYIAAHLLESGRRVKTITTHVDKLNPFAEQVKAFPYNFDRPDHPYRQLQRGGYAL